MKKLFSAYQLGKINLKNRIVMAPMTRSRATVDHVPTDIMTKFYAQRASAGLLITEGTSPSPNGLGYPRIPGIFSLEQVSAWKKIADAVHVGGGKIFMQLMHTGRASHPANMAKGTKILAPSAIGLQGQMWTDSEGMQNYPVPQEMTEAEIHTAIQEYADAAAKTIEAGLDGVELHSANGYLMDQFLNPASNKRTDVWGKDRSKFALEVTKAVVQRIGAERVGIRLSPYGVFNDMVAYPEMEEFFLKLTKELSALKLVYLHLVDHSAMGAPPVSADLKRKIRESFVGTLILSGGYDAGRAEADLQENKADLIAYGRPFISNPDLVEKLKSGEKLKDNDATTFYTPGEKGYLDY